MRVELLLQEFQRLTDAPDAIPRLRGFVLDLAIRGKLVGQKESDEPAHELLARITAIKAGHLGPKERSDQSTSSALDAQLLHHIPDNWAWSCLASVGLIGPRNEASDDQLASFVPMPYISPHYGVANGQDVRPWAEIKIGYTHFAEGDVGLAKITPCFENGKSTVFRNLKGGIGAGTTELHIVRPILVNPEYLLIFLKSPRFVAAGIPKMTGTAGQQRVSRGYFATAPLPLPPLAEQKRIVAKVDELMARCDKLDAAQEERDVRRDALRAASLHQLMSADGGEATSGADVRFFIGHSRRLITKPDHVAAVRKTILDLAVRGRLVPQDPGDEPASALLGRLRMENIQQRSRTTARIADAAPDESEAQVLFPLPPSWTWARFSNVARIQSHLVDPANFGDMPHIAPDNIESGTGRLLPFRTIRESAVSSNKHLFQPGVILYSKIRPALAKAVLVDFAGLCSADMYPILSLIDRPYLHKYMLSDVFVEQSVQVDNRVAMPKINRRPLGNPRSFAPLCRTASDRG